MNIMGTERIKIEFRIASNIFENKDEIVLMKPVLSVGLNFAKGLNPFDTINEIMHKNGFKDPEELKTKFSYPKKRFICLSLDIQEFQNPILVDKDSDNEEILQAALILGLSSLYYYDPSRPVIWTKASLQRGITLYDPAEFYR